MGVVAGTEAGTTPFAVCIPNFKLTRSPRCVNLMDPNRHQQMGLYHLSRVLSYAPFVASNGTATVHLTPEDWHVVADTLFHMETPRALLPAGIEDVMLHDERTIRLHTSDLVIEVTVI